MTDHHCNDDTIYLDEISCLNSSILAVKCNDDPIVIQTLAALGAGFDCASKGEISKVMSFGVHPEAIIFANPTKPVVDLKFALKMNVDLMTVDGGFELHKIAEFYPNAK